MSWFWTCISAILGALCGGGGSLGLGLVCVGWYRISSFEGKSGFFVAGVTLAGLVGGLTIGLIAARIVAAGEHPRTSAQLLAAVGAVALFMALAALVAFAGAKPR